MLDTIDEQGMGAGNPDLTAMGVRGGALRGPGMAYDLQPKPREVTLETRNLARGSDATLAIAAGPTAKGKH
eukprot:4763727-Lingulodinium_polyedra.AAC.1